MKTRLLSILSVLVVVFALIAIPADVTAQTKKKTKAQIEKERLAEKKAKDRAKAQEKKEKEKAKKEREREKEKAKREKEKERANDRAFNQPIHYVTMWGGGGYSGMVNNYQSWNYKVNNFANGTFADETGVLDPKFIGGGGGLIGAGWEVHYKRFMVGLGPEVRLFTSKDEMSLTSTFNTDHASLLTWGPDYGAPNMIQHYALQNMMERQVVGQVTVPIVLGGNFEKVYFLAGAKVGYSFLSSWRQYGRLTTTVTVPQAVEDWGDIISRNQVTTDMTKHPLYKSTGQGSHYWGLDLAVTAEVGVNLNEFFSDEWNARNDESEHPWRFRVGAFVDYGMPILSVRQGEGLQLVTAEAAGLKTNSLHESTIASSKVSSLLVGLKFTALFQLNKPKMPNPMLQFFVSDTATLSFEDAGIGGATVEVRDLSQPKRKPRTRKMGRDGKLGMRMPKGRYDIIGRAPGYLPSDVEGDTLHFSHEEDQNIAHIRLIPEPRLVIFVHNSTTEQLVPGAKLSFSSDQDAARNTTETTMLGEPAVAKLHYGDTYGLITTAEDYHADTMHISRLTDTLHINLRPLIKVRRTLILKHMYFATDKSDILPESEEDLIKLYTFLSENPRIRVLITGHTDNEGRDEYNQRLSEMRSASVKAEMVKRGIDPNRMETDGRGESEPIDTNDTPEGRQNNRRVQVTVLNELEAEVDVY